MNNIDKEILNLKREDLDKFFENEFFKVFNLGHGHSISYIYQNGILKREEFIDNKIFSVEYFDMKSETGSLICSYRWIVDERLCKFYIGGN